MGARCFCLGRSLFERAEGVEVLRWPGYPQLLYDALHLARRGAGGVHLGHRRHDRAVDALVALDHVLRGEAARPQLRYPRRDVADALTGLCSR